MAISAIFQSIKKFFKKIFHRRPEPEPSAGPSFISNDDSRAMSGSRVVVSTYQPSINTEEEKNIFNNDPMIRSAFKNHKADKERNPHLFVSSSEPNISYIALPKSLEYNASTGGI